MKTILNEGLDYHDLVGQVEPIIKVDEYVAKMVLARLPVAWFLIIFKLQVN